MTQRKENFSMKRQLTAILAAALCLGLLGGCAAGKDAVSHPPAAGQTGSVSALPTDAAGETPSQPSDAPELS